jgi:hypothetical protein
MWFFRKEDEVEVLEIPEFNCPFGYFKDIQSTLQKCLEKKSQKYQGFFSECATLSGKPAKFHTIIYSSCGAVDKESLKCLKTLL